MSYRILILCSIFMFCIPDLINCRGSTIVFPKSATGIGPDVPTTRGLRTNTGGTCYTKEGAEGKCLPIKKCPELLELITSKGGIHTPGTADFLKKRICGYAYKEAHLCCLNDTNPVLNPILPTLDECGIPSVPRIVRGENFTHGTHPWLVGVGYKKDRSTSIQVTCGGTLITKRHVLTAAHCFLRTSRVRKPQLTHVILGEHSLSQELERRPPIIVRIADRKNPGYNSALHYKDIELLVLEREISFSNYIKPACLPFKDHLKHFDLKNMKMVIAGWGTTSFFDLYGTDTPREAFVSVIPLPKCQEIYKGIESVLIDETQICLGGDGRDTCGGDSGGPAIYEDTKNAHRHFLLGITAFGHMCGDSIYPGVYTYVPAFMDWIVGNL